MRIDAKITLFDLPRFSFATLASFVLHFSIVVIYIYDLEFQVIESPLDKMQYELIDKIENFVFEDSSSYEEFMEHINSLAMPDEQKADQKIENKVEPPKLEPPKSEKKQEEKKTDEQNYEKIISGHVGNVASKIISENVGNFLVQIYLRIDSEGRIIEHKFYPEPNSVEVKTFLDRVVFAIAPLPKPPIEYVKEGDVGFVIPLKNTNKKQF